MPGAPQMQPEFAPLSGFPRSPSPLGNSAQPGSGINAAIRLRDCFRKNSNGMKHPHSMSCGEEVFQSYIEYLADSGWDPITIDMESWRPNVAFMGVPLYLDTELRPDEIRPGPPPRP